MQNRIGKLGRAQEKIEAAMDLIREAVSGTDFDEAAERTVLRTLRMCVSNNHTILGSQYNNVGELIDTLNEGNYEDIDEDEDWDDDEDED